MPIDNATKIRLVKAEILILERALDDHFPKGKDPFPFLTDQNTADWDINDFESYLLSLSRLARTVGAVVRRSS